MDRGAAPHFSPGIISPVGSVCVSGRGGERHTLCSVLLMHVPADRFGTCCVPLALRTCSVGQRQYLGELAADVLVGTGSTALPPVPQKTPAPLSPPFLGHRPVHRLLRSQPPEAEPEPTLSILALLCHRLPCPAAVLVSLFLGHCSWISLGWAAPPQYCTPAPSGALSPTPLHQMFPGLESSYALCSPCSLCVELCHEAHARSPLPTKQGLVCTQGTILG